ncbi:hypothetical protein MRX96_041809 [Rhipicephalus microplus]
MASVEGEPKLGLGADYFTKALRQRSTTTCERILCMTTRSDQGLVIEEPKLRLGVMGLISGFSFSHILDILGFGEKGIKAGTVAAAYQASKKSKVGRFSLFSYLQYVGAKRLPKLLMSVTLGLLTFCICFEVLLLLTAAVVCSMDFILDKVGFGKEGVKPGSLAATWQASMHGNVPRWSKFALLQSWGVKGIPGRFRFWVGKVIFFFTFLLLSPHSPLEEPR